MSEKKSEFKDEMSILGRGIARTFVGDIKMLAIGAICGALIGLILATFFGVSLRFGLTTGAMLGGMIGILTRSISKPLFDYDRRPPN